MFLRRRCISQKRWDKLFAEFPDSQFFQISKKINRFVNVYLLSFTIEFMKTSQELPRITPEDEPT